jgi:DNA-binding MarR family transcriptional regulator
MPTTDSWKFLTSHALVLATVADAPDARISDISAKVGITDRAAHGILKDLESAGYVRIDRVGRRNRYRVNRRRRMRHPMARGLSVGELIELVGGDDTP